MPGLVLQNRQRRIPIQLSALRHFARNALASVLAVPAEPADLLAASEEISIALVSDRAMAKFHLRFMGIAGPTDVLTFEHGEILISAETASRYAKNFAQTTQEEIALYILHGLLHLRGFNDILPADRKKMHRVQNQLFKRLLREEPVG